jgi:DNA mismatch repair ATPase MutS
MGDNRRTENPLEETSNDRVERELRNNFNVLMGIDKRLDEIANAVEANTANIEILEEAVSAFSDIPTRPIKIRYNHRENKLWINERFFIKFEKKEADVFGLMFFVSSGLPKKVKFQYSEVAEMLRDHASFKEEPTIKAVQLRVKRIEAKLNNRLKTKGILIAKTKEFYISFK